MTQTLVRQSVLQHAASKLYYAGSNMWVTSPSRALLFVTSKEAITYALLHGVQGAQALIYPLDRDTPAIVVPIQQDAVARPVPRAIA